MNEDAGRMGHRHMGGGGEGKTVVAGDDSCGLMLLRSHVSGECVDALMVADYDNEDAGQHVGGGGEGETLNRMLTIGW